MTLDPKTINYVEILKKWNGDFDKSMNEPTLYTIFEFHLFNDLFKG